MNKKELSTLEKVIIEAFAEYDMKAFKVSKNIYVSRGTVLYHAKKIKEKTGLDIRKFYDLCLLLDLITNQR